MYALTGKAVATGTVGIVVIALLIGARSTHHGQCVRIVVGAKRSLILLICI